VTSRFGRTRLKTERARELRRNQTLFEAKLWAMLRDNRIGPAFRRQHPVGPFILDFYCPDLKLGIEVDGAQHFEQQAYDARRTRYLNAKGIHVIRFTNGDVLKGMEAVSEIIAREIEALTPTRSAARSDLPLSGGGFTSRS